MQNSAREARFLLEITGLSDTLHVLAFSGTETLSGLYTFDVTFACEQPDLALKTLRLKPAQLRLHGDSSSDHHSRDIHGEIAAAQWLATGQRLTQYRIRLVPKLWFLQHRSNCRIFQDQRTPEIIRTVLEGANISAHDYTFLLREDYPVRVYCVQYRESDYDFIVRLMQENGLYFYHQSDGRLIISDGPQGQIPITGNPSDSHLPYRAQSGLTADTEIIYQWHGGEKLVTDQVALRDFDWEKPHNLPESHATTASSENLQRYDFPGGFQSTRTGQRKAQSALDADQASACEYTGQSNCPRLSAGHSFTLAEHPRQAFEIAWLLVSVHHTGRQPQALEELSGDGGTEYHNSFDCIPANTPCNMRQIRPKPEIRLQSAMVTGPPDEEIYTDEHGRIKVQFPWDRQGQHNQQSSAWLRVRQSIAGPEWGHLTLPRIGQEVLVDFINGDPDQPIVTGGVYNGTHPPPYPLPQHKARTVLKTQSTPNSGNFHELRIDDRTGQEQLLVRAAKDMDLHVKNDYRVHILHDQHEMIDGTRFKMTAGHTHSTVSGSRHDKIGGDRAAQIEGDSHTRVRGASLAKIGGDYHIDAGGTVVLEAGAAFTIKSAGGFIKLDASGVTIQGAKVNINSGGTPGQARAAAPVSPQEPVMADSARPGTTYRPMTPSAAAQAQPVPFEDPLPDLSTYAKSNAARLAQAMPGSQTASQTTPQAALEAPALGKHKLRLRLQNRDGTPKTNHAFKLSTESGMMIGRTDANGLIAMDIQESDLAGRLEITTDDDSIPLDLTSALRLQNEPIPELAITKGIQARLNNMDYDAGTVDGVNGPRTKRAVEAFQADQGLVIDGEAGPITQTALNKVSQS